MVVKHDTIIPYLELGRLEFHAYIPNLEIPNIVNLVIKKNVNNGFVKQFEIFVDVHNKSLLVELLRTENAETVFGLKLILSKSEASELNSHKGEITDYLTNLEKYYRGPDA